MHRRGPSIDKLAFHQEFYSFVYLFLELPIKKKVLILERKWGKLSHPFGVSVNPQPWKQVQPVDCNFRKQATLTSIQPLLLSSLAERQRPYGGSGGGWQSRQGLCWSTSRWQCSDNRYATRNIENRDRVIYFFFCCGELWQSTTCVWVCAAYTQNVSCLLIFWCFYTGNLMFLMWWRCSVFWAMIFFFLFPVTSEEIKGCLLVSH